MFTKFSRKVRSVIVLVVVLLSFMLQASACDDRGDESMRSDNAPSQMWNWVNQFAE